MNQIIHNISEISHLEKQEFFDKLNELLSNYIHKLVFTEKGIAKEKDKNYLVYNDEIEVLIINPLANQAFSFIGWSPMFYFHQTKSLEELKEKILNNKAEFIAKVEADINERMSEEQMSNRMSRYNEAYNNLAKSIMDKYYSHLNDINLKIKIEKNKDRLDILDVKISSDLDKHNDWYYISFTTPNRPLTNNHKNAIYWSLCDLIRNYFFAVKSPFIQIAQKEITDCYVYNDISQVGKIRINHFKELKKFSISLGLKFFLENKTELELLNELKHIASVLKLINTELVTINSLKLDFNSETNHRLNTINPSDSLEHINNYINCVNKNIEYFSKKSEDVLGNLSKMKERIEIYNNSLKIGYTNHKAIGDLEVITYKNRPQGINKRLFFYKGVEITYNQYLRLQRKEK